MFWAIARLNMKIFALDDTHAHMDGMTVGFDTMDENKEHIWMV